MVQLAPLAELLYLDASGSRSALTIRFPVGTAQTEAATSAMELAASVASMTGCIFIQLRIKYQLREDAIGTPDVGASITRRGVWIWHTTDADLLAIIEFPGIKDSAFMTTGFGAGYLIDDSNTDVIALETALIAANACDPFGHTITTVESSYLQSRV